MQKNIYSHQKFKLNLSSYFRKGHPATDLQNNSLENHRYSLTNLFAAIENV